MEYLMLGDLDLLLDIPLLKVLGNKYNNIQLIQIADKIKKITLNNGGFLF